VALPRTEATKFAPRFIAPADESTADDAIVAVGTALRIDDDAALSALQATEQHLRQTNSESDTAAPAYAVFATHTVAGVVLSLAFHEIGGALSRTRVSNLVEGLSALKTALAHLCSRPLALERAPALLPSAAAVGVWMHAFEGHTAAGRSSVRNQPDITLGRVWNYAPRSHSLWRAGRGAAHPAVGIGTPTRDPVHVRGALVVGPGDARVAAVSALLEVSNEHPPAWRSAPALADPSLAALPRIEATLVIAPAGALQRWCAFAATTRNVHVVARWADYERLQIEYLPTNAVVIVSSSVVAHRQHLLAERDVVASCGGHRSTPVPHAAAEMVARGLTIARALPIGAYAWVRVVIDDARMNLSIGDRVATACLWGMSANVSPESTRTMAVGTLSGVPASSMDVRPWLRTCARALPATQKPRHVTWHTHEVTLSQRDRAGCILGGEAASERALYRTFGVSVAAIFGTYGLLEPMSADECITFLGDLRRSRVRLQSRSQSAQARPANRTPGSFSRVDSNTFLWSPDGEGDAEAEANANATADANGIDGVSMEHREALAAMESIIGLDAMNDVTTALSEPVAAIVGGTPPPVGSPTDVGQPGLRARQRSPPENDSVETFARNEVAKHARGERDICVVCVTDEARAVLPCGHSFCWECISRTAAASAGDSTGRCPNCNHPMNLYSACEVREHRVEPPALGAGAEIPATMTTTTTTTGEESADSVNVIRSAIAASAACATRTSKMAALEALLRKLDSESTGTLVVVPSVGIATLLVAHLRDVCNVRARVATAGTIAGSRAPRARIHVLPFPREAMPELDIPDIANIVFPLTPSGGVANVCGVLTHALTCAETRGRAPPGINVHHLVASEDDYEREAALLFTHM